jgi:hypothetical protein
MTWRTANKLLSPRVRRPFFAASTLALPA